MAIIRWDPFAALDDLHGQMNSVFNQAFEGHGRAQFPTTDVYYDDDKQMVIEAHLPNFTDSEVSLNVHDGSLEIQAEHKESAKDKDKRKYVVRESSSSFYRRISLPTQANEDKISADFKNGLLKVTVPFKALPKPKKITITGGKKK